MFLFSFLISEYKDWVNPTETPFFKNKKKDKLVTLFNLYLELKK